MKHIIFSLLLFSFFTPAISQVSTLEEGFENWPPTNWEVYELGAAIDGWIQSYTWEDISHSGEFSAYSSIDNSQCDNWLVSPIIDVNNNSYELRFWEYHTSPEYYDRASVHISTGSNDPNNGDFVEIFSTPTPITPENWEERVFDLSSYEGQSISVAFRYEGTWHKWYVDDVTIKPINFTDGALTEIINPVGVSETTSIEDLIITVANTGTTTIQDIDISWEINGVPQTPYNTSSLNLSPGNSTDVTIGSYNFNTSGLYTISALFSTNNDFDSSNNLIEGNYTISNLGDGALTHISPEGMSPNTGVQEVKAVIENLGDYTIDIVEIIWSVNGITQIPFTSTTLNLLPGTSIEILLGQFNFSSGLNTIQATLDALGDINSENDNYTAFAAIDTFWESFEGQIFPPENWSIDFGVLDNRNFGIPVQGDKYYSSFADNNIFGAVSDTIVTPLLTISSGDMFNFYIKNNSYFPLINSILWIDGITGEIHHIQDIEAPTDQWEFKEIDISVAAGNNYIAVTSSENGSYGISQYDMFTSDAKLYIYDNDLAIKNGDIYFLAKDNVNENFNVTIKNYGALQVSGSEYTVKLMEVPGIELASTSGITLNSWEETTISLNHTFTEIDQHRLYFEIDYNLDENSDNNIFRESTVHVVPESVIIDEMGSKNDINLNFPFDANGSTMTLGEDDISQSVYHSQDFENPGDIYGLVYSYDNLLGADHITELPLKIWVSQTEINELSSGFVPYNELVLVFDGVVEILPGFGHELYIPFDQPISYTGLDNILVQNYQYDPAWPPAIVRFYSTHVAGGDVRTISLMNVYDLDPTNPGIYFNTFEKTPYTRFVIDPTVNYSALSGKVLNIANIPLSDATVSIDGTSISVQTDSNGNYSFPDIAYGTYNITASIFGYNDLSETITLDASTVIHDFYLMERAQVEITGTVFGSNNVSIPLEFVQVSIEGYINDNTATDTDGNFIFSNIYGNSDYDVIFSLYGYNDTTITISVIDQSIDMGTIILEQEFISPFDVSVTADTDAIIIWNNPLESTKVKLQNDLDEITQSYTNEPFEDVWLGNIISISDITTLTSVEIRTDIYQLADDFVSIDVFDVSTEEIIASSVPFIIYPDTTLTIDIPNIVVYEDIAVMVHWQNNPESTNALALDNSDPTVPNTAVIKYSGEAFQLMSEVVGVFPYSSFLVRINTLDIGSPDTNNEVLTYNVYRGLASEFPNTTNWEVLNSAPITGVSFEDLDWATTNQSEQYRYAVETIYVEGESEVTFSNSIDGALLGLNDTIIDEKSIILYPVPASEILTIQFENIGEIQSSIIITDVLGKIVAQIEPQRINNGYLTTNISQFTDGIYFVKIDIDGHPIYKRFIIRH